MYLGSFDKKNSSMRIYYLKDEHYISTFLVEILTGTEYISTQRTCEKTIVGVENLYNEISKFKEKNNENGTENENPRT